MQHLIGSDHQLNRDQDNDNYLKPERSLGIDQICEDLGGVGNDGQLARERFGTLL
jgi:hypothetical protein